jgi:hypothetical protein
MFNSIKEFINKVRFSKGHGGIFARGSIDAFIVKLSGKQGYPLNIEVVE